MTLVPIRNDNAYLGFAKQSVQGTAVAPTVFPRWLDGSSLEIDASMEDIWEGDGSRHLSQVIRNKQSVKVKLSFNPRPVELGFFEAAAMGTSSDAVTAATLATTITGAVTAGVSASATLTSVTGLGVSGTVSMVLEAGTSNEEVAIFQLPASGSTLTLVSSYNNGTGKFAKSHAMSSAIATSTAHVLTDQVDSPYYTMEVCLGGLNGGAGPTLRIKDCKLDQIKRSGKAGSLIGYEIDFVGTATTSTGAPATVTLEAHQPFFYTTGSWTLNSATTGDAANVESFDITQKNNVDTTIQTEAITMAAYIFGNINVDFGASVVMTNSDLIALTYFGSASGTTDAQAIGVGNLTLLFTQADGFHSVQYLAPTLHYTKASPPQPKKDGKHFVQPISASSVSNNGANAYLLQTTVNNAQSASY